MENIIQYTLYMTCLFLICFSATYLLLMLFLLHKQYFKCFNNIKYKFERNNNTNDFTTADKCNFYLNTILV